MATQVPQAADLAAEVRRLSDRAAISELADRYLRALDEGNFDQARASLLFTEDVELRFPPGDHDGLAGVAEFTRGFMAHWARTHHNVSQYQIELAGDEATIAWNLVAIHVHRGSPPPPASAAHFYLGGRFEGVAVRTGDGWRLRRLELRVAWTAGPGIGSIAATMTDVRGGGSIVQRAFRIAALLRLRLSWLKSARGRRG